MAVESFEKSVDRALADAQLRKNFAFAMGNFILKRRAVFSDPEETERLRTLGNAIKQRALSRLPDLLEQLEAACTRNGIRVHWAETTAVANRIVLEIIESHAAGRVVKGKSMVSEEMHLNAFLVMADFLDAFGRKNELFTTLPVARLPILSQGDLKDPNSWRDVHGAVVGLLDRSPNIDFYADDLMPATDIVKTFAAQHTDGSVWVAIKLRGLQSPSFPALPPGYHGDRCGGRPALPAGIQPSKGRDRLKR